MTVIAAGWVGTVRPWSKESLDFDAKLRRELTGGKTSKAEHRRRQKEAAVQ